MAIRRLGKEREANVWSSERYNSSIKRYMETQGFGLYSDSFHEGHLPDIVMVSTWDEGSTEVWIESKNTVISLSDKDFKREILGYFKEWTKRDEEDRFALYIFAQKYRNPAKWEQTFGSDLDEEVLEKWLKKIAEELSESWVPIQLADHPELVSGFFSSICLYQTTGESLEQIVDERGDEGVFSSRQAAGRHYAKMEQRMRLVNKPDKIIGNCLRLHPPREYLLIRMERSTFFQIREAIRVFEEDLWSSDSCVNRVPPYAIFSDSELLVLNTPDALEAFSFLSPKSSRIVTLNEVEEMDQRKLVGLLNVCVLHMFLIRGAEIFKDRRNRPIFYFPLLDRNGVKEAFKVKADKGRNVSLSTPMNKLREENDFENTPNEILLSGMGKSIEELNFGFHRGITSSVRKFWGEYWAVIGSRRIYTSDGIHPVESDSARRLDEFFRNPLYNRSESQFRILRAVEKHVFRDIRKVGGYPGWLDLLEFNGLWEQRIGFSPVKPMKSIALIDSFYGDEAMLGWREEV